MKKKDSLRSPQQCIKNKLITLRFIFSFSHLISHLVLFSFFSSFNLHFFLHFISSLASLLLLLLSRFVFILFFPPSNPASQSLSFYLRSISSFLSYSFIFFNLFLFFLFLFFFSFNLSGTPRDAAKKKKARETKPTAAAGAIYKTSTPACVHPLLRSSLARTNPFFFSLSIVQFSTLPILSMIYYSRAHKFVSSFVTRICLPLDKQKS